MVYPSGMSSGGLGLIRGFLCAGCVTLAALVIPACSSSPPPGGGYGSCAPGIADGVHCAAVGAACGYGYTTCKCNKDGKWHCDTAKCPGKAPHPGSDCPASLAGLVCNYPGTGCQCVATPGGYQWGCQ